MPDRLKSMIIVIGLFTFGLCLLPMVSWAATLYAKQEKVKVTAKPSPTSTVIATLRLGEAVTVLAEKGRSVKVKTAKKKVGWVFKFRLASKKPNTRSGSRLFGLTGRRTIAARESRAGGSIRGLKESTQEYAKRKQIKPEHQEAVDKMEAFVLSPETLTQFQRNGQLGEFAGGIQ